MNADIEKLRAQRLALIADRDRIAAAPLPEKDVAAAIPRQVEALTAGLPPITMRNLDTLLRQRPAAVLAALVPEALGRLITADLHAAYGELGKPMTAAAKAKELARLDGEIEAIEIAEERAIRAAEAAGEDVDRRADAAPEIVLIEEQL